MLGAELRRRVLRAVRADQDVMLYAARVSVWARWLVWLVGVFELAYRPELWYATDKEYLFLGLPLLAFNGFVHYRLRRDRMVTWRWLLFLSGMDVALITAAVIIGGDFHIFSYVAYYPALALFAVVFASLWLSLAWATMAAAVYACRQPDAGPGPRLRCRSGEGPAFQGGGHVCRRRIRQPHRPLRTGTGDRSPQSGSGSCSGSASSSPRPSTTPPRRPRT